MNQRDLNRKFVVDTNQAPRAIGPYSQAVGYNGLLFVSGQIALDPKTGEMSTGGVEAQTRRVMENLQAVLMAAGLDFSHVLKTTIYLRNMNDFALVNEIYALYFDHSPPARATIEVSRLPKDALVEIELVAAAPSDYTDREEVVPSDTGLDHPGPDEWEAQHKELANQVHQEAKERARLEEEGHQLTADRPAPGSDTDTDAGSGETPDKPGLKKLTLPKPKDD